MARTKPILILCPEHRVSVPGVYECRPDDPAGDQTYDLNRVRCSQHSGRCAQTLCVLHRYNKRGPASWYPEKIIAVPDKHPSSPTHPRKARKAPGSTVSFEA